MGRRALFLDRDGTLIVDVGYPRDPEQVEPLPGAASVLRDLQRHWLLVVISNQSGIGRGLITPAEATAVHDRFVGAFARDGVAFAGFYYCPHAPEAGCACRKPLPGLLVQAAEELRLDLRSSAMVGDKASDIEAGRAAGTPHLLRLGPDVDPVPVSARCDDWPAVYTYLARLVT